MTKEFLIMIHSLLMNGINSRTATENMMMALQIEDICKGFCIYVDMLEEKAEKYDNMFKRGHDLSEFYDLS